MKKSRSFKALVRSESGNVAMMWALMGTVLIGLVGMSVDFTRAQTIRSQMQNAVDGAALVAERSSNLSISQREAAARAFFDAEMGENFQGQITLTVSQLPDGGHQVNARMPMPVSLARVVRTEDWQLRVSATAQADASPPIEVALVLDNTGSMSNDMGALRDAAHDLATDLMSLDGDSVRVALVPFVAQVNVGNGATQQGWLDQAGNAAYNGELLEDRSIAHRARTTSGTGNTGSTCQNISTQPTGYNGPYRLTWRRGTGGSGGNTGRCYAWTPEDGISYWQVFQNISNDAWKGCVEARPEPYDVTDAPPSTGTPDTMFVPFFWLDTIDNVTGSTNSYFTDTVGDIPSSTMTTAMGTGSGTTQQQRESRMFNVFKYRNNSASLDNTAPDTRGPNRGCPTPIVPLTSNDNSILSAINNMSHWNGGGTNQAEGLAWGWRVLSPGAPFTQGAPYDPSGRTVRKVLVLMSDGENTNVGDDPVLASDYSAYNHLGLWRDYASGNILTQLVGGILRGILPPQYRRNINSDTSYVTYVNNRQTQVCNNIKAAGIEIYVVRFRNGNATTMRNCATDASHYFEANSASELSDAFRAIGSGIGALRLTH